MQSAGASLLGRGVSKTISKGLAKPEAFADVPEVLA
jgi:phosphate/sulfate permease